MVPTLEWKFLCKVTYHGAYESDPSCASKVPRGLEGGILYRMQAGAAFHLISLHFVSR